MCGWTDWPYLRQDNYRYKHEEEDEHQDEI